MLLWETKTCLIFLLFQEQASGSEAIGQIYQDEKNMAAILMRRQLETGDLMMVSGLQERIVLELINLNRNQKISNLQHNNLWVRHQFYSWRWFENK